MANVCTNLLFFRTESDSSYQKIIERIQNELSCYDVDEQGENECEVLFESRWIFPQSFFESLTEEIGQDDTLFIRVLSYEFACDYVGYNIYQHNKWIEKV